MFSKSLAVGALAAGCVAAAASGAYVAVRQNASATPPVAVAAAPQPPAVEAARPVAETEAVVTPSQKDLAEAARPLAEAARPTVVPEPSPQTPRRSVTTTPPEKPAATGRPAASRPNSGPPMPSASSRSSADTPRGDAAASAPARDVRDPAAEQPATVPPPTRVDVESTPRPEVSTPPSPQFEQLVVPASSVIGLQVETSLTTERARLEDRVEARVTRDVLADGRVAIPVGARAVGTVMLVERGGKVKERARLGVRFHTLVLADGTQVPISTEAVYREGESPAGESSRKIGGAAVGGAILGALIGGKKGAVVGGATGAAGGTAVVMAGDRNAATLPPGTLVTIRLAAPVAVEVEKR